MNAIRTRYHVPTNHRGGRFCATDGEKPTVKIAYDYALSTEENHRAAAQKLMEAYDWTEDLIGAWHGDDMYWIRVPKPERNAQ
ncbi:MAG: hypothetical protein M1396_01245 [Chloroflexi bacterium]|nr:hypothetical protein [Chloroflexota bacterium]